MIKKVALTAAVVSLFSVPAFAGFGNTSTQDILLQEGSNPSKLISSGQPHTYQLNLEQDASIRIGTDHFPGMNHSMLRMEATLVDASGNVVAEVGSSYGDFEIQETLSSGSYRLMVSGNDAPGGDSWHEHRYSLHVDIQ